MAFSTTSPAFSSLYMPFPSINLRPPSASRAVAFPIKASVSDRPITVVQPSESSVLPLREVPGNYGLPVIGPFKDRLDYFYDQGRDEFFKTRIEKYKSTVFRVNVPPGPFIADNPNVVVLLDGKSFPVLFDTDKVEKRNLFTGTYMPSTDLTGGYRMLSYLDPSEPNHGKLKQLIFLLLKSSRSRVMPEFRATYCELFSKLEEDLRSKGKADFNDAGEAAAFRFLCRSLLGVDPAETNLGGDGPNLIGKWVLFSLHPVLTLGIPKFLEEPLLHTFRLPPALIKRDYARLYDFFSNSSAGILNEAEKLGISREEACHNILFSICFNSFGGMKILFSNMLKNIGRAGVNLHTRMAEEIRSAIRSSGGEVTMAAMEKMELTKSVVYESLRIEPPVPAQYGRAKKDLVVESHDAAFRVRAGEMLFGYQPFATKDPKIFDRPEEFVAERFVGKEGEKLLRHVVWSNGPESEKATVANKQCAGKDFVVMAARLFVIELFRRYDTVRTICLALFVCICFTKAHIFCGPSLLVYILLCASIYGGGVRMYGNVNVVKDGELLRRITRRGILVVLYARV